MRTQILVRYGKLQARKVITGLQLGGEGVRCSADGQKCEYHSWRHLTFSTKGMFEQFTELFKCLHVTYRNILQHMTSTMVEGCRYDVVLLDQCITGQEDLAT